jgi:hypothetical protein
MSWSIDLKANRKIPVRSVRTALLKIGAIDENIQPQEWGWLGWPGGVDVLLPRGRTLTLSGGFNQSDVGAEFAIALASALRRLHFKISVGPINM